MLVLNLGCGHKASESPNVVNIDWSISLRVRKNPLLRQLAPLFFRGKRWEHFKNLPNNIVVHDLSKGIPFKDHSVDVVYHSHLLEHLDPPIAEKFTREIHRVLRPGGIIRIVVPDFELLCRLYMGHLAKCEADPTAISEHDAFVAEMIEQSTRREAAGTSKQSGLRRRVENYVLGDARRRGETHQWMYDRFNLSYLLTRCGFADPQVKSFDKSGVAGWDEIGLDRNPDGTEYKYHSLYLEATAV